MGPISYRYNIATFRGTAISVLRSIACLGGGGSMLLLCVLHLPLAASL